MSLSGFESEQQRPLDAAGEIAAEHGLRSLQDLGGEVVKEAVISEEEARERFRASATALQELRASGIDTDEKATEEEFLILEMDIAVDQLRKLGLIKTVPFKRNVNRPTFEGTGSIPGSVYAKATVYSRPRLSVEERERMEDKIIADPAERALHVGVTPAGFIVRLFAESESNVRVTVSTSSNSRPIVVTAKKEEAMAAFHDPFKFRKGIGDRVN